MNTSVRAGMTLAAQEIAGSSSKVIDVIDKYGYDSPGSFAKAFHVYSDVVGQAFYFKADNGRTIIGQPSGGRNTALCVPEPARNQGFGGEAPKN